MEFDSSFGPTGFVILRKSSKKIILGEFRQILNPLRLLIFGKETSLVLIIFSFFKVVDHSKGRLKKIVEFSTKRLPPPLPPPPVSGKK